MTMTSCWVGASLLPAGGSIDTCWVLTTCCGDDSNLPFAWACRRRRCMEANTSACCVANAYPNCCNQDRLLLMVASTTGNGTSDLTLGSHDSASSAFTRASPD